MKLSVLVNKDIKEDAEITGIKTNSKDISKGDLFVCIKGANTDRHDFIDEAVANGASAVIVSKDVNTTVPTVKVNDSNESLKELLNRFYDNPLKKLKGIGITGTDGASHNGLLDLSLFGLLDNITYLLPRDKVTLEKSIEVAASINNCPSFIRYPKGFIEKNAFDVLYQIDKDRNRIPFDEKNYYDSEIVDVVYDSDFKELDDSATSSNSELEKKNVLIIAYGNFCGLGIEAAKLVDKSKKVKVVNPLHALPISPTILQLVKEADYVVTLENGLVKSGLGEKIKLACLNSESVKKGEGAGNFKFPIIENMGVSRTFLETDSVENHMKNEGLTPENISKKINDFFG